MRLSLHHLPALATLALLGGELAFAQQFVPAPPVVGDGSTPATLQILTPRGARIKVVPSRGTAGTPQAVDGGWVFSYVPPAVGERGLIDLVIRVRGGGVKEDVAVKLPVVPGWNGTFSITLDPAAVASGQGAAVRIRPSSGGPLANSRTLRASVSAGTLTDPVAAGDGSFVARWTAPRTDTPVRPVVVIADAAAPGSFVDSEALPVTVNRPITLPAPADSMNVLRVGDREYGPSKASAAGTVSFEVEVHPDRLAGTLSTNVGGTVSEKEVPLGITVGHAVAIAPLPGKAGGGTILEVPVGCRGPSGAACAPSDLKVEVSAGSAGAPTLRGDLLIVPWTLPDEGDAAITVRAGEFRSTANLDVVGSPVTLTLSTDPPALKEGSNLEVTARAKDPAGKGVVGRIPGIEVRGAKVQKRPIDNRDGTYTGVWKPDKGVPWVEAIAWPKLSPTGLAVQRLVAFPVVDQVQADGSSEITLVVVAEDAVGMPVPNTTLELAVPVGDGAVPPSAKTDANGIARIPYKVGVKPGLAVISVQGAGLETSARLWQAGPKAPAPALATVGSAPDVAAIARWKERIPSAFVGPAAPAPVAVVAAPVAPVLPGTAPTPATTPGDPVASGGTDRPPKAGGRAPSTGELSQVRARAAFLTGPVLYQSTLKGEGADLYAPEASFVVSPALGRVGVHADLELWVGAPRKVGLDLRARAAGFRLAVGPDNRLGLPWDVEGGFRYRAWEGDGAWSAYAGAGAVRTSSLLFAYTDATRSTAKVVDVPLVGARVGGGLRGEWGPGLFELDLQTIWGPVPSVARLEARGEIAVADPILLHLSLGLDARNVGSRPPETEDIKVNVRQLGVDLRVGVATVSF